MSRLFLLSFVLQGFPSIVFFFCNLFSLLIDCLFFCKGILLLLEIIGYLIIIFNFTSRVGTNIYFLSKFILISIRITGYLTMSILIGL